MIVRKIKYVRHYLHGVLFSQLAGVYLRLWGVKVGKRLRMQSFCLCRRCSGLSIEIGDNVRISNKLCENPAGVTNRTVLVAGRSGARIKIGNNVGISGAILYCSNEIVVEDNVQIGAGVKVYDTDFHPVNFLARREHKIDLIETKAVCICQDVWLGANATILKGVTIGERSIVATGAVVTKDVPNDVIVAGVPAKVVKSLV